jgi:rod shape-determining protein MreC
VAVSRRSGRRRFTLVLLVLTAVTLLTLDSRGFGPLDSARSAVLSALSPVGDVAANVFRPVGDAWDGAFNSDEILDENEQLRRRVDELEGQLTDNAVARESLEQLLEQVGIPFVADYGTVNAKVVSGAVGNFDTTIELDKGSDDGIQKGMPVITGRGLIGRVTQVSGGRAQVQLVTDGDMQVGFSVVGTPIVGLASGTGRSGQLEGTVNEDRNPSVGDIVTTSGLADSPYPPGIPIGTITAVNAEEGARLKRVDITMLADLYDLTFASVVLYTPAP